MSYRTNQRIRHVIAGMLVLGMCWGLSFQMATAHAVPERTNPPMDQAIPVMPQKIDIWFSEEVKPEGTKLDVLRLDGTQVDMENTELDLQDPNRAHVTVGVHPGLDNGVYIVQWTTVSAVDGDTISGSYRFTIDPAASPQPLPQTATQQIPVTAPEIASDDHSGDSQENRIHPGIIAGVAGVLLLSLLLLWFFRRPASGRRWKDDVVDRL